VLILDTETLLATLLLSLVTLPLVVSAMRTRSRRVGWSALGLWLLASAAAAWGGGAYNPSEPDRDAQPIEVSGDDYVTSRSCKACHPHEYDTWHSSFHRTMTQFATPETVIAPWDAATMTAHERTYRIEQRGDEFWVEMEDTESARDGRPQPRVWRRVVQTTGAHHFQFYWTETLNHRKLSLFPFCYRIADEPRWMPVDGCCVSPPTSRQEAGTGRWSTSCNKCHATHGRPRVTGVVGEAVMDTHVAELGIACEACHGPGQEHVDANRDPRRRYALYGSGDTDPTVVNPALLDKERSTHVCARCHSVHRFRSSEDRERWSAEGFRFRPGDLLTDTVDIDTGGEDKFWADGVVRVTGREGNGLFSSPCYQRGEMSCLSCHDAHQKLDDPRTRAEWADDQLKAGMRTDMACTQCHAEYKEPAVLAAHTHHAPGSSGSLCMNCHMPYTTTGLLKAIRSHTITSPDAAETADIGRPNACNLCHLDKTLEWTAKQVEEWYGTPPPELDEDDRSIAASLLWALRGDAGMRVIVANAFGRASAREVSGSEWMTPAIAFLMTDPYHVVRYVAERSYQLQQESARLGLAYDFVAPPSTRSRETLEIFEGWGVRAGPDRRTGDELLIAEDGQLMIDVFNRLLSERDDRPVTLNE
jgi:hypothetical protein